MSMTNEQFTNAVVTGQIDLWYGQFGSHGWHVYIRANDRYFWLRNEPQGQSMDTCKRMLIAINDHGAILDKQQFYPVTNVTLTKDGYRAPTDENHIPGLVQQPAVEIKLPERDKPEQPASLETAESLDAFL